MFNWLTYGLIIYKCIIIIDLNLNFFELVFYCESLLQMNEPGDF